jgi:hypothetical protein
MFVRFMTRTDNRRIVVTGMIIGMVAVIAFSGTRNAVAAVAPR